MTGPNGSGYIERPYCVGCGTIYDGHHDHCPVMAGNAAAVAAQRSYDRRQEATRVA